MTQASRELNPWLANYGFDRYTYKPEKTYTSAARYAKTEGPLAHGYPYTSWLQLSLLYAIGLYTAKE